MRESLNFIIDVLLCPFVYLSARLLKKVNDRPLIRALLFKIGIFPIIDHYYQPPFRPPSEPRLDRTLPGIDFNPEVQLDLLDRFNYNEELEQFSIEPASDLEFSHANPMLAYYDAEYLYNVIRYFKPRRIIEIGAGYSTLMATAALSANGRSEAGYECEHICIEPYERDWLENTPARILRKRLEEMPLTFFSGLSRNDILFIDSSHVIRPDGDVVVEVLEILPILNPGTLIHFHDIFSPRDYYQAWGTATPIFMNEQYLVEAFLTLNPYFKIIGALNYLKTNFQLELAACCPVAGKVHPGHEPGSLWLQKVT